MRRESFLLAADLRAQVGAVEQPPHSGAVFGLGDRATDARLSGGLAAGRLHEAVAGHEDDAACVAFALLLGQRVAPDRPLLWIREDTRERDGGYPHAPGMAELGIDPARMVLVCARDATALLKAANDAVHCGGAGALVVEVHGKSASVDLTATRRLALAAERSGVTVLLARPSANPAPSAARTRWRIAAAPSTPLEGDAPGFPAFAVELLRDRGGCLPFTVRLEWDRERLSFRQAPLSGGMAAVSAERTDRRAA